MSTFRTPLTKILEMKTHPNADALELAQVYSYEVIVPKGLYRTGDMVVYIPDGSVLSPELESFLYPEGSKIKLNNRRIRAIKLRGIVSQGILIAPEILSQLKDKFLTLEDDVSSFLGVTKYQPPITEAPGIMRVQQAKDINKNPDFKQYTDIEHGKYYDRLVMVNDELVIVTQKLHGTSARFGWFPRPKRTLIDRIKAYFNLLPEYEFCWGSRRCQINSKPKKKHNGFKSEAQGVDFGDVYTKIKDQDRLMEKIPKGYAIYGEIVGWGIQKGYLYNCGIDEHKFYVYDVYNTIEKRWLNYHEAVDLCHKWGLTHVPLVYQGPYIMDNIKPMLKTNTISNEINEGIVVKPISERTHPNMGRVILKYINDEYLLRDQTEFQ